MSITMLKKLGAKQILGNVRQTVKDFCAKDGDVIPAYSIFGTANGVKSGVSQYGDWVAFVGNMEAVNHASGERFAAVQCFIPEPLQTILLEGLEEHENIEFSFTVKVKRRDDLKEGYEYLVEPHKQATEADPLEKLRAMVPNIPALQKLPDADQIDAELTAESKKDAGKKSPAKGK